MGGAGARLCVVGRCLRPCCVGLLHPHWVRLCPWLTKLSWADRLPPLLPPHPLQFEFEATNGKTVTASCQDALSPQSLGVQFA